MAFFFFFFLHFISSHHTWNYRNTSFIVHWYNIKVIFFFFKSRFHIPLSSHHVTPIVTLSNFIIIPTYCIIILRKKKSLRNIKGLFTPINCYKYFVNLLIFYRYTKTTLYLLIFLVLRSQKKVYESFYDGS